jgi:hypothetical protein
LTTALVMAIALSVCLSARIEAQTLSIQGDRFAIDGTPRFLTFISYFGAMGAGNVTADLRLIRTRGFDGIRIWPLLFTGPQLFTSSGSLRPEALDRLLFILDRARDERLVVDVSFTGEHISGLNARGFRDGIVATAAALRSYDNILFDIENESDIYGPGDKPLSRSDIGGIRAGIKSVHPSRIVTSSVSSQHTAEFTTNFTAELDLDVTTYHDPREFNWFELEMIEPMLRTLKGAGRPVYLQEPMPTRDFTFTWYVNHDKAEYFLKAAAHAKLSGAAAWCFHSPLADDLRGAQTFLEDVFRAYPEPEWAFMTSLLPARVNFKAANEVNYLQADGGGGGAVRATSLTAGSWETFTIAPLDGVPLVSGDRVTIAAPDGRHYLQAAGGGGGPLRAAATSAGAWETFVIEKADGGGIRPGDPIRLRVVGDTRWYVAAEDGGGGNVMVNRSAAGSYETFRLLFP